MAGVSRVVILESSLIMNALSVSIPSWFGITILRTVHRYSLLSPRLKPHPGPLLAKERDIFWWLRWLGLGGDKPMQPRRICPLSLAA
jgi:hypothetical protein